MGLAVAKRLNAHVVVGFPEKKKKTAVEGDNREPDLVYYNSIAFVDPQGHLVTTYAKSFLYYTDENWAEEGPGFKSIEVDGLGKVTKKRGLPFPKACQLNSKKEGTIVVGSQLHS